MCGRYELHAQPAAIALAFGLAHPPALRPRYNVAPMQEVPVVRVSPHGARELVMVRWGLVPRWAKDPSIGSKMINARGETVAAKPSFRTAFRRHRCLIPANGFYEWMPAAAGRKQPVLIAMKDGSLFAFAGLYERWLTGDGEPLDTCTVLTTDANALLRAVHDRMPVIVPPEQYERWLDPAQDGPQALVAPYPAEAMTWWPVSSRVNSVRHDDATLIERLPVPDALLPLGADAPQAAAAPDAAGAPKPPPPEQPDLF
jgi:putative SOS response-associated peptidase YedK